MSQRPSHLCDTAGLSRCASERYRSILGIEILEEAIELAQDHRIAWGGIQSLFGQQHEWLGVKTGRQT